MRMAPSIFYDKKKSDFNHNLNSERETFPINKKNMSSLGALIGTCGSLWRNNGFFITNNRRYVLLSTNYACGYDGTNRELFLTFSHRKGERRWRWRWNYLKARCVVFIFDELISRCEWRSSFSVSSLRLSLSLSFVLGCYPTKIRRTVETYGLRRFRPRKRNTARVCRERSSYVNSYYFTRAKGYLRYQE